MNSQISDKIKYLLHAADPAHDYQHIERVRYLASLIAADYNADREALIGLVDLELVDLVALLHEVGDRKVLPGFTAGDVIYGIEPPPLDNAIRVDELNLMIKAVSWSNSDLIAQLSPEDRIVVKIVADADRLDAMGAIGVARCLTYSGAHNCPILDDLPARIPCSLEDYRAKSSSSAINHFLEKLLIIDQSLHTRLGKEMGKVRKERMVKYLLNLAEETGYKFQKEACKLLTIEPKFDYGDTSVVLSLSYTPSSSSLDSFAFVIGSSYKADVYCSADYKQFIITKIINKTELLDLVYKYLPDPEVLALCH